MIINHSNTKTHSLAEIGLICVLELFIMSTIIVIITRIIISLQLALLLLLLLLLLLVVVVVVLVVLSTYHFYSCTKPGVAGMFMSSKRLLHHHDTPL